MSEWKPFIKENLPLPLQPVLLYIVDSKGKKFTIMSGHVTDKLSPRVFDIFSGKFKAIPKKYQVTQWWLQETGEVSAGV